MAFPLALLGLVAGLGGAAMQYQGQKRAANATSNVWSSFRDRNRLREQEAANVWNQNLAKSGADTAEQEMREGAEKRRGEYARVEALPSAPALPTTAKGGRLIPSTPTKASRTSVKNAGSAWSKLLGGAQAKVGSVQDDIEATIWCEQEAAFWRSTPLIRLRPVRGRVDDGGRFPCSYEVFRRLSRCCLCSQENQGGRNE